ncbi:MAG TPA: class I SAM-dependent methyltransferase [Nocardioidaceae bacterium]|nr:class I SAM-dependent methyltransferase [Nocardioidaceae bacterium]
MEGFDPFKSFGPEVASRYDEDLRGDEAETVEFLADLAGIGPVLEFAIGTGRIGLPLAARGIDLDGIEQSAAMVDRLREKTSAAEIDVTVGDMTTVEMPRRYSLVFLVFNTIHNVLTQDGQVRCFENAARHLDDDGVFVVETGVPCRGPREGSYIEVPAVAMDEVRISPHSYDAMTQILDINHMRLTAEGIRMSPISLRLVYPSELDLMARIAGLRLRHRWGGWKQEAFTVESRRHVSVYERA